MHSTGLTKLVFLLICLSWLAVPGEDEEPVSDPEVLYTFEQQEAEQVTLRFWVPAAAVEDAYPQPLGFAASRPTWVTRAAPSGMVECLLVLRCGTYRYTVGGEERRERKLLDGFLLLDAAAPAGMGSGGQGRTFLLVEYYCSSRELAAELERLGVPVKSISGKLEETLRPDNSEMVDAEVQVEGFEREWHVRVRTVDDRRLDTGPGPLTAFFQAGEGLRALEITEEDDYFMKAVAEAEYGGSSPLDRWQGWQPAADPAFYQYNRANAQKIISVAAPVKN
jgi:hypothetical protein